jgi:hypothetical protein
MAIEQRLLAPADSHKRRNAPKGHPLGRIIHRALEFQQNLTSFRTAHREAFASFAGLRILHRLDPDLPTVREFDDVGGRHSDDLKAPAAAVVLVWAKSRPRPERADSPVNDETPVLAGVSRSGRYWARTSDPQLVELVLSQLS